MPSGSLILLPMSISSFARRRTIFGAAGPDHLTYVNKYTGFQRPNEWPPGTARAGIPSISTQGEDA
jgi:hypothetical protein